MVHSKPSTLLLGVTFLISFFGVLTSGQKTNFVNHDSKVKSYAEPGWFKENIPFVELPAKEIEEVYYYRWSSHKRHLRYTTPGAGYITTEFIHKVDYALKFDTINAAAGHHIHEGKWLRNRRYVQDYINFWTREGGDPNKYSEWIADAAYASFLVDGDLEFIKSQQSGFVRNYNGWAGNFDPDWGLYWISPLMDAMEFSCSSVQTDDPFGGGAGYRPSFNGEMYANALAISKMAALNNDLATAREFQERAAALQQNLLKRLWDPERKFFYHAFKDNNVNYQLLDAREEIGFYPWQWGMVPNDTVYSQAWDQLFDQQGFDTLYGPSTCEVRSQWYDDSQESQCCWWNGNSWPYSTSLTLTALAAQIRNYGNYAAVTTGDYVALLEKYALTQYKNDKPYVAECHSPVRKHWVCDSFNHSEHYAHSTYTDNVISGLLGVEPQPDDTFQINPLVPNNWRFFALENLAYHGHDVTVLWDVDGRYYESGHSGLQIFVNGQFVQAQPTIGRMKINIPPPNLAGNQTGGKKMENYAANPNSEGFPAPRVSYNIVSSSPWHPLDGRIFYDYNPTNRWTNYGSGNETDWFEVDFGPGRSKTINQVKLYVYSDVVTGEGRVDCPTAMAVEVFQDELGWTPAQGQIRTPAVCSPNDLNTIDFDPVSTERVRVLFTRDVANDYYVGLTELEIWAVWPQSPANEYEAEDGLITGGTITRSLTSASGGSYVAQLDFDHSSVEFTGVWIQRPGTYFVKVFYANGLAQDSTMHLRVNNDDDEQEVIFFPTVDGWGHFKSSVTVNIPLQRGNNVIILRKGRGFVELDKIQVLV